MANIKFNGNASEFYTDLKNRVEAYFAEKKIDPTGNGKLYFKTAFYMLSFLATYITLVFFTPSNLISVLLCISFGFFTASIGFNVMHDGGHGSYSNNKTVNKLASYTLNMLGGSSYLWNIKHNMIHHTFTNVDGHDDDIATEPLLRLCKSHKKYFWHRFQFLYWFIVYGLTYALWIFILDVTKYFNRSISSKTGIKFNLQTHLGFWITKIIYIGLFVVLPIEMVGITKFLVGYSIFLFTTGLYISVIFQLAHAVEDTEFVDPAEQPVLENDWAVHQVKTTANFGSRSKVLSFLTGGLNQQVEHHLFPKISHVHYPKISLIVKETCSAHGLVYLEHPTIWHAVASHVRVLYKLGRN